jgi:glycosyltransferase involved in cell wall biosynthesis
LKFKQILNLWNLEKELVKAYHRLKNDNPMPESPLVSVAMPVYNAENYLVKAIDSVLNQTYPHFELIIVNDASSDRSKEIIHSYSDPRIRYIENPVNLGISKTRNICVTEARGKYIAVLDNDDIALPTRLERQVKFLESNIGYGVCGCFFQVINQSGKINYRVKLPITDKKVRTFLLFDNCLLNSSVMIRGNLLKEKMYTEGFDMMEDYYFLYTISKFKKLSNLPFYGAQYRVHGKNTSIAKLEGMRMLRAKISKIILHDLQIPCSEEEFNLHTQFVTSNFQFFKSDDQLEDLVSWLLKLYRMIRLSKVYDMGLIRRMFIMRWSLLIRQTGQPWIRIFHPRLFSKFTMTYIKLILAFIPEKLTGVRSAL